MGVNVTAVNSGYSDEGDTSVGGENVLALKKPKIAIAADEGVTQESYGGIWWTFDKYGIKFTPMTIANDPRRRAEGLQRADHSAEGSRPIYAASSEPAGGYSKGICSGRRNDCHAIAELPFSRR